MHLVSTRVFERRSVMAHTVRGQAGHGTRGTARLRATAAIMLSLVTGVPSGFAQQAAATSPDKQASNLPAAPTPTVTEPLFLRSSSRDFSKPADILGNPINMYRPTPMANANFANSVRLDDLVKGGKIYLSLSDAIALALENNFDLAIARYNLDIADTDILRAKSGTFQLLGVNTGLVTGTLSGASQTLATGGGPGGTTVGAGGGASGSSGLTLTASGAGPIPETLDPSVSGTVQLERAKAPQANTLFSGGKTSLTTNTDEYNFSYNQGFVTGTQLTASFNNSRITTDNPFQDYSPYLNSSFKATVTQHLLQGAGIWVNKRLIYQAINDRRITDSSFRQQILYTVNQVENIYWALVSAYEDVQAKQQALQQSTKLASDTRKQLEIGTMAPLDVVTADSNVATDKQALINSQSSLYYQQLIIKQAIARNLNDPALVAAPVIPTDRVSLEEIPEEKLPPEELVQEAFKNRPELEQAVLTLKNDEITLKGARNGMLPTLDAYAFYGASALGGAQNPGAINFGTGGLYPPGTFPSKGYGNVFQDLFDSTAPDKGVGITLNIPIRNRLAQSIQARSQVEYHQAQLRLEQLYTQIRIQVVNAQYALTNDRALVEASEAAERFNRESRDDEVKKLNLGASTASNVLLQEKNLANAENNLIAARAGYARDRASLYQLVASTLQHYGINLNEAATGQVTTAPAIPGLQPAKDRSEAPTAPPTSR